MGAISSAGRIGVWGRSGSGKSAYVKHRIRGRRRVVVFDPLDEYDDIMAVRVHHKKRDDLDRVRQAMAADWRGFRIAYVPPSGRESAALSALSRLLMRAQAGLKASKGGAPLTLVVEEMNMSFPVAGGAEKSPGFAEICSRGRHYGIEVIGLSQRIAEVSTRFRGNCTETVVLAQREPRDVTAAVGSTGAKRADIERLKNLEYIYEAGGALEHGKVQFR